MAGTRTCAVCGKQAVEKYTPFCSKRCADVDLARWLGGVYRIATDESPDSGDWPPDEEETE